MYPASHTLAFVLALSHKVQTPLQTTNPHENDDLKSHRKPHDYPYQVDDRDIF